MTSPRIRAFNLLPIKNDLEEIKAKANKIAKDLKEEFSFEMFEALFYDKPQKSKSRVKIYALFKEYIDNLMKQEQIGTAKSYITAQKSIQTYALNLALKEIIPQFLYAFEKQMLDKGRSISTVSIYLRSLRTIMNIAKEKGLLAPALYPFGSQMKKKYEVPIARNIKKALEIEDTRKIKEAEIIEEDADFARDIWLFSFYCNGMNIADICKMKHHNIDDGFIYFFRAKTIRTQRDKTPIEVYLSEPAEKIISKWSYLTGKPNDYIFPVLKPGLSVEEEHRLICNFTRSINHYMKKLAVSLGIKSNLTTYVARHSYATSVCMANEVSMDNVAKMLGHSDTKMTRHYARVLDKSIMRDMTSVNAKFSIQET